MSDKIAPAWGTADEPAKDPTSDTVTMVIRLEVGNQTEVIGIGIRESDWEYDVGEALTDLLTRFVQEAVVTGIVPQAQWHVSVTEE